MSSEWPKEGNQALCLCFVVWMANCQTTKATHLCFISPRSLVSAAVHTAHPCIKDAYSISLLLSAEGSAYQNPTPPDSWLSPTVSPELQGCVAGSSELFSLLASLVCSHLSTLDVSIRRSLRHIRALSRDSFVELQLFKLLKL